MNNYSIKPILNSFNRGTKYFVEVLGGTPPFTWFVTGADFSFASNPTTERNNILTAAIDAELGNTEEITVTDANGVEVTTYCTLCGADICCDDPNYSFNFSITNKTVVIEGRSIRVGVKGGCSPYTWSIVEGDGFSFPSPITNSRYNYLHFDKNVNSLCKFTVVDGCDNSATVDVVGQALCDPPCPDGDTIIGIEHINGGTPPPPCNGDDYSFYWQSEEDIEIWDGGSGSVTINGGKSAVILRISNSIDFSFGSVDGGIDEYYCEGSSSINVPIYGASEKGGTGLGVLTATDGCLLTPVYPTGTGMINLKLLVCCEDLPDGVFTFDGASTPDTIVKASSIGVYVTGGCPPFTFATSSLGYTFDGEVTSLETNNRSATLSCVNGTCGTNFSMACSFTVTDSCDQVVSAIVRNTSGHWELTARYTKDSTSTYVCTSLPRFGFCSQTTEQVGYTYDQGDKKWDITRCDYCASNWNVKTENNNGWIRQSGPAGLSPPCGGSRDCGQLLFGGGAACPTDPNYPTTYCLAYEFYYYSWVC